jgi:type VI secretion system FHA domain protein
LGGASSDLVAENLGVILRETVNGLVEVLRDRANFKSEFRLDMTRIQATENNPLKFSTTTDDVVRQLLTNERAGLMEPGDAFREAFDDLRIHQLAMMVALKACLNALMAQLDPAAIEEEIRDRGGLKAKMFSSLGGEGWDKFVELYSKLAEDADEGFRHLLGDEFGRAYEEQVNRLQRARFGEEN